MSEGDDHYPDPGDEKGRQERLSLLKKNVERIEVLNERGESHIKNVIGHSIDDPILQRHFAFGKRVARIRVSGPENFDPRLLREPDFRSDFNELSVGGTSCQTFRAQFPLPEGESMLDVEP